MTVVDFFSTSSIFLIFPKNVIGPDASEKHFRSSGGSGRASGGVQGRSWEALGRSWDDLGTILERLVVQSDFGSTSGSILNRKGCQKGGIWGAKTEPKSIQRRVEIEVDF